MAYIDIRQLLDALFHFGGQNAAYNREFFLVENSGHLIAYNCSFYATPKQYQQRRRWPLDHWPTL